MKILWILDVQGGEGGTESVTLRLDAAVTSRGNQFITVLTGASWKNRNWESKLSKVYIGSAIVPMRIYTLPRVLMPFVRYITNIIRREKPDIIVANWAPMVLVLRRILRWTGCLSHSSIIVYEHGAFARLSSGSLFYQWIYRQGLKESDHVICGGDDYAIDIEKIGSNMMVSAIGLPITVGKNLIPRSNDVFYIVFVGRLENKQKRVDRLLKACSLLPNGINWLLQIIGDGPDRETLENMAYILNVEKHVIWSGWQSDPWSSIDSASILAFPSDFEGFGAVVIEAMAHGIPVLATDCNFGPRSIITEGVNGWLVDRNDHAFAQKLQQLAIGEIPLPNQESIVRTVDRFNIDQVAERFLSVCAKVRQSQ